MALYQPGRRSNLTFLISSLFTIILLTAIITGHLVIGFAIWFYFAEDTGMKAISGFTGLSETLLWISIITAVIMDVWVVINMRKGHQKAKIR